MKKYLALSLLGSSLFTQSQFVQNYNIDLNIQTNKLIRP
jgi:hypothetical protein